MKPKWHGNLLLICEKCGTKLNAKGENPSLELKNRLKKQLTAKSLWGSNRVVTTSCLDICPEGKVAIAFVSDRPGFETQAEIIDPLAESERVLLSVLERAMDSEKDL